MLQYRLLKGYPGIRWRAHILPYQHRDPPTAAWAKMEWSCIYAMSTYPDWSSEYFVIDRHFSPITKGESVHYLMGKTPLVPQRVCSNTTYYGEGIIIPYYPLQVQENLFLGKPDPFAAKRVEISKDDTVIYNDTELWALEPLDVGGFLESYGYGQYSFIVSTETGLDSSSDNCVRYGINYTASSNDLLPPTLLQINAASSFCTNQCPVTAKLTDEYGLKDVSISYSEDDGPWVSASVQYIGDGVYSANLSIVPTTQRLSLLIEAEDNNGNTMWFRTMPISNRGISTEISAALYGNVISGELMTAEALLQPVYLRVSNDESVMYTLTDIDGAFSFEVPQSFTFPMKIEMISMGPYCQSSITISAQLIHDIAIIKAKPSKTVAYDLLKFNVSVSNQGDFSEVIEVIVYCNTSSFATSNIILASHSTGILTFTWNATLAAKGLYVLKAVATPVPGEADTSDNTFVDGWVTVTICGDIDGDFDVDIFDIVAIAGAYGSSRGSPKFDPNSDLDGDDDVDIFDLVLAAVNYGSAL